MEKLSIGCHVIYTDEHFVDHSALVTAIWGEPDARPCINLLCVCTDQDRQDQYGRQIERTTSVVHANDNSAGGLCWRFVEEDRPQVGTVMK